MSCSNLPTDCTVTHARATCNLPAGRQITFKDVASFFTSDGACSTHIAYIDGNDNTVIHRTVMYKTVTGQDCVLLYTRSGNFVYVYDQMLFNLIIWATVPGKLPAKVIRGNHLTIGMNPNGSWNIHETMYKTYKYINKTFLQPATKKRINYNVSTDTTQLVNPKKRSVRATAAAIWNDIVCWTADAAKISGNGKPSRRRRTRSQTDENDERMRSEGFILQGRFLTLAPFDSNEQPATRSVLSSITAQIPSLGEGDITPFSYVPVKKLNQAAATLLEVMEGKKGILVTDTHRRCTFLWIVRF
jgi:hypothetical protein